MYFSFIFSLLIISISLFATDQSTAKITRDDFGMAIISGGNLADIADMIGKVQAEDRLSQIFLNVQFANGRGAKFFGKDFINSDILQHQLNYTDAEVQSQIDNYFTEKTKTVYENFVKGLNSYVAEVNANISLMPYELKKLNFGDKKSIPYFTLYDILRTNQFILQKFSPSSIPNYQLNNLSDLTILIEKNGKENAMRIFNDINPTSAQINSPFTIVPDSYKLVLKSESTPHINPLNDSIPYMELAKNLDTVKKLLFKSGIPSEGSVGVAISAAKSASANPMIRISPQPNFNHPSDFYQIRIESHEVGLTANYFTIPSFPFSPNGVFNQHGVGVQVGNLPSNDFLFESANNAIFKRKAIIEILNQDSLEVPIYRSKTGGWVLKNPVNEDSKTIMTLRSVFIDKQLKALNPFIESAFSTNFEEFKNTFLKSEWQTDLLLFEGNYVDANTIAVFHTGGWTSLGSKYDRRFPQGDSIQEAPSNDVYSYLKIVKQPLLDLNTPQGFYIGWNSLFKQGSETVLPVGVNRVYWLDDYIRSFKKLGLENLKQISLRQYVANNNTAFNDGNPDEDADLFTILFKNRFFQAVKKYPTKNRLQAVKLLQDFTGEWFDGDLNHILHGLDISDKRILASVWLNAVANRILNPYVTGTSREVATATIENPIPTLNPAGKKNGLLRQSNTLSRIFGVSNDNTLFFDGWLKKQPKIDQIIVEALDFSISILGGFDSMAWGKGKRGIHKFNNLSLGSVQTMPMCNTSGCIMVAEFSTKEIRMETILALGQSGEVLGNTSQEPQFNKHSFDQQEAFINLQLRYNPPFKVK
jgi:hypothetical protein